MKIKFLLFTIFCVSISTIFFIYQKNKCYQILETQVNWTSMIPFFSDWQIIQVKQWYYDCHEVERWDIVIYGSAAKWQLVKQVRVLWWDRVLVDYENNQLIVNSQILKSPRWQAYRFTQWELDFLALFIKDWYLKQDNYFIFWTHISGGYDSRKFAGVLKKDFIWKVIYR